MPKLSDILWDYLPDKQTISGNGGTTSLLRQSVGPLAGVLEGSVDIANQLANLSRALDGYAGNKPGLSADQMPQLEDKPIGGSEWIGQRCRTRG